MRVDEFEQAVLEIEEIVIRIRARPDAEVGNYDYRRRASAETSVTEWLNTRIIPNLNGRHVSIVSGHFNQPHGRTKLRTLRDSYDR